MNECRARGAAMIGGTAHWMRSEQGDDCICCDGRHAYSYVVLDDRNSVVDWYEKLWRLLREFPDGARVRFSVELTADTSTESPRDQGENRER